MTCQQFYRCLFYNAFWAAGEFFTAIPPVAATPVWKQGRVALLCPVLWIHPWMLSILFNCHVSMVALNGQINMALKNAFLILLEYCSHQRFSYMFGRGGWAEGSSNRCNMQLHHEMSLHPTHWTFKGNKVNLESNSWDGPAHVCRTFVFKRSKDQFNSNIIIVLNWFA